MSQNIKADAIALAAEAAELRDENVKLRAALEAIIKSTRDYTSCGAGCDSCGYCSDVPRIAIAALAPGRKEEQA